MHLLIYAFGAFDCMRFVHTYIPLELVPFEDSRGDPGVSSCGAFAFMRLG